MPIYLYECEECGLEKEEIVSFSSKEKYLDMKCPACHEENFKMKISKVSFRLKGPRWFKDGYSK